jgi:hypothetical protein
MFKQLSAALFLFCTSISSYAYVIESNLLIHNNTDTPMLFTVTKQDGELFKQPLPAHSASTIKKEVLNNGDHTGLLYRAATQRFEIRSDDASQLYVQGRVVYYIHGSYWQKYSFLDSVSAAEGLSIETGYNCEANTAVADNSIAIDGKPGATLRPVLVYPKGIYCRGLKASTLDETHETYRAMCTNGRTGSFGKDGTSLSGGDAMLHYLNSAELPYYHIYTHLPEKSIFDGEAIKATLDKALNTGYPGNIFANCGFDPYSAYINCNEFCGSWSKENAL